MDKVRCVRCGKEHDLRDIEPSFDHPDARFSVPDQEREFRVLDAKDECAIRTLDDSERRYFLRVGLPIPVHGEVEACHWGVWVEVSDAAYYRTGELWDDPEQDREPPFNAKLANALPDYEDTLGLPGFVRLTGPKTVPLFELGPELDHPLAIEQREGVWPERVLEWVWRNMHGERDSNRPE